MASAWGWLSWAGGQGGKKGEQGVGVGVGARGKEVGRGGGLWEECGDERYGS